MAPEHIWREPYYVRVGLKGRRKVNPLKNFFAKVEVIEPDGCWLWRGAHKAHGYGHLRVRSKWHLAHRFAHLLFVGPIPEGHEVHHLCGNPPCVRPSHLEAVTPEVNNLRSNSLSAQRARQTHCKYGHAFTEDNTRRDKVGRRKCRACDSRHNQIQRARRLARAA